MVGKEKGPITPEEFSGGPCGDREEVALIKHTAGLRLGWGMRNKEDLGSSLSSGSENIHSFIHDTGICAWAGLGGGPWPALLGLPCAIPSQHGLQRTLSRAEKGSRLGVITESFSEQLTFMHEFDQ